MTRVAWSDATGEVEPVPELVIEHFASPGHRLTHVTVVVPSAEVREIPLVPPDLEARWLGTLADDGRRAGLQEFVVQGLGRSGEAQQFALSFVRLGFPYVFLPRDTERGLFAEAPSVSEDHILCGKHPIVVSDGNLNRSSWVGSQT